MSQETAREVWRYRKQERETKEDGEMRESRMGKESRNPIFDSVHA